jgi:hypothetical protein
MTVLNDREDAKHPRMTAFGKHADQLNRQIYHISNLPYELLEQIACCIDDGEDLVKWIRACKGSANLGDLG